MKGRRKDKTVMIGWLMFLSQLLLLLFVARWLTAQYGDEQNRLREEVKLVFDQTHESMTTTLLDRKINMLLDTTEGGKERTREFILGNDSSILGGIPVKLNIRHKKEDSLAGHRGTRRIIMADGWSDTKDRTEIFINGKDTIVGRIKPLPDPPDIKDGPGAFSRITINPSEKDSFSQPIAAKALRMIVFKVMEDVNESFGVKLDTALFRKAFEKELNKKSMPFSAYQADVKTGDTTFVFTTEGDSDKQSLSVTGQKPYLFKKIIPQISFSLVLLLLGAFSFILAYRSLIKQKRLAIQKDSFISNISHELKTPVATTKVALEALSNYNALLDPKRSRDYLHMASWEMDRLENLISRILNTMQSETGSLTLERETFDLVQLIRGLIDAILPLAKEKPVQLIVEGGHTELMIYADRLHLQGALYNLLDNALKYGGDDIRVVVDRLEQQQAGVLIMVSDNGPGIPEEYRSKIFEKFFRVPSGNRHDVKGHGLGLSYTRSAIEAHEGKITLQSRKLAGTSFIITLPDNIPNED
jgi:signal transduction histidine kinase